MPGERGVARLTRRQLLRGLGASGLLLTAGCSASSAAVSARGASGSPRRGGTIVLGQTADIEPKQLTGQTSINAAIGRLVYNTLTEYDHMTLQPRPSLATSWQQSADGTTMTLRLRDDVTFHTGRPFTAQDVIFTLQQQAVKKNSSQLHATAAAITDMTAVTPHELVLRLAHPVSNLFDLFEMAFIIDRETFPELQDGARMVGTGPFIFEEWNPGDSVNLTRNPHYWKAGLPVHRSRPGAGPAREPPDRGHVPGPGRRDRPRPGTSGRPATPLYPGAAIGFPGGRTGTERRGRGQRQCGQWHRRRGATRADRADWRRAEPAAPAVGLPVPHEVPGRTAVHHGTFGLR